MVITFGLAVFAWVFFRAENLEHSLQYISGIFSKSLFTIPTIKPLYLTLLIFLFMVIEWLGREEQYAIAKLGLKWKAPLRYAMYYTIVIAILWFAGKDQQFIYFQF